MKLSILISLMALGQAGMHTVYAGSCVSSQRKTRVKPENLDQARVQSENSFNKLPSVAVGMMAKPLSDIDRFRFLGALGFDSSKFREYRSAVLEHAFPPSGPIKPLERFIRVAKNQKIKLGDPEEEMYWALKIQDEIQDHYLERQHNAVPYPVPANSEGRVLLAASRLGYKKVVVYAIENQYELNVRDPDGLTPILCALNGRNVPVVRRLIAAGAALDAVTGTGATALHFASAFITEADKDILIRLISVPGLKDGANYDLDAPLHTAVYCKNLTAMRVLIDGKVDINAYDGAGRTPLGRAIMVGESKVADVLIEGGADLNRPNMEEDYPLIAAIKRGNDIALALIDAGADTSLGNPLQAAAWIFNVPVVSRLLDAGVDPNLARGVRAPNGFGGEYYRRQEATYNEIKTLIEAAGGTL